MNLPAKAPLIAAIGGILGAGAGLVAGVLIRQPEINKLKKQVKSLQRQVGALQEAVKAQNEEIAALLLKLKSLKIYQVVKKHEVKNEIREALLVQYASKDYLQLVLECARGAYQMDKEDIRFYNAYNKLLAEKKLSQKEQSCIDEYVQEHHQAELSSLQECDIQPVLDEIESFEKEEPKPKKKFRLPFRKKKDAGEESPDSA